MRLSDGRFVVGPDDRRRAIPWIADRLPSRRQGPARRRTRRLASARPRARDRHAADVLPHRAGGVPHGSLRLSATLVLPNTPGPHPAIVMVHGSGPATRDTLRPWADVYARAGVAVLISDKRGSGASMGSWSQATFDDLAGDALAGLAFLQGRPEINPRQVGLHGMSLGSWVAPLAALRSRDVAFVIAESAPALTPVEHELMRVEHQLRADGFPRLTIARARAFMDEKFKVARTGEGWDALNATMTRAAREGWLSVRSIPPRRSRACGGTGSTCSPTIPCRRSSSWPAQSSSSTGRSTASCPRACTGIAWPPRSGAREDARRDHQGLREGQPCLSSRP